MSYLSHFTLLLLINTTDVKNTMNLDFFNFFFYNFSKFVWKKNVPFSPFSSFFNQLPTWQTQGTISNEMLVEVMVKAIR